MKCSPELKTCMPLIFSAVNGSMFPLEYENGMELRILFVCLHTCTRDLLRRLDCLSSTVSEDACVQIFL